MVLQPLLLVYCQWCKISRVPTCLPLSEPNVEVLAYICLNKFVQKGYANLPLDHWGYTRHILDGGYNPK